MGSIPFSGNAYDEHHRAPMVSLTDTYGLGGEFERSNNGNLVIFGVIYSGSIPLLSVALCCLSTPFQGL